MKFRVNLSKSFTGIVPMDEKKYAVRTPLEVEILGLLRNGDIVDGSFSECGRKCYQKCASKLIIDGVGYCSNFFELVENFQKPRHRLIRIDQ